MSDQNCGCTPQSDQPKKYIMIEASASSASTCGESPSSSNPSCRKTEPEYDSFLNGFIIPLAGNQASVAVCNASLYAVGQWIQTVSPIAYFKIVSIIGNTLNLVNQCPSGEAVPENPDAGQAISNGSLFYPVGQPPCKTEEQKIEDLNAALENAESICVPEMIESSDSEEIQPVGRVNDNPNDSGFKKCIKRIAGIFFRSGSPYLSSLVIGDQDAGGNHRKLGIEKSTNKVIQLPSVADDTRSVAGKQYTPVASSSGGENIAGPAYATCLFDELIKEVGIANNKPSWLVKVFTTPHEDTISLNIPAVTDIIRYQDHYYANVHFIVSISQTVAGALFEIKINNQLVMYHDEWNGDGIASMGNTKFKNIVIPIKVLNSENHLKLEITQINPAATGASVKVYYRVALKGLFV